MRKKREQGITLVALIITIIILVILAAVTIKSVLKNGIVDKALAGTENYAKEQYKEVDKLEEMASKIDDAVDKIENITAGTIPTITIKEQDKWTREKTVTITKKKGYTTKYTLDGTEPSETNGNVYEETITVKDNCKIKAVYISSENEKGRVVEKEITKIDKLSPKTPTIEVTAGKHSMGIKVVTAEDKEATDKDGKSDIASYKYHCDSTGKNWESEWITDTTYTFGEVYGDLAGVNCIIYVEAKDNAGNTERSTNSTSKTTCLNTTYYRTRSNFPIMTAGDYVFYKTGEGAAIIGHLYTEEWVHPLIVSNTSSACLMSRNVSDEVEYCGGSGCFEYHGVTYYYSDLNAAVRPDTVTDFCKFPCIFRRNDLTLWPREIAAPFFLDNYYAD